MRQVTRLPFPCKNQCGAQLEDSGATSTGKNGTIYKVYAELIDGEFKKGPTGQVVNHAFDCPKRKSSFNQAALDKKHAEVEAGTYYSKGSAAGGEKLKTRDERIEEMSEKNRQVELEKIKAYLELASAIRYLADRTGHNITPSEDNFETVDPDAGA